MNENISKRNVGTGLRRLAMAGCMIALCGSSLKAQTEFPRFAFDIGGGFTQPVGNTSRHLDTGWNVTAGAGFNFNSHVGALVQFQYNMLDINGGTLTNIGVPGGDVKLWS